MHFSLRSSFCLFLASYSFSTVVTPQQLHSFDYSSPKIQEKKSTFSKPFVDVTKRALPCVVSIEVEINTKKLPQSKGYWDDPIDPFQDDFWQRFFGLPSPGQQQRKKPTAIAHGSGFVVSSDGLIFTNNHLIDGAEKITVTFHNGKEYPAELVGRDPSTDIALLKIDAKNLPYLILGDSDELEICEWVIAIGSPLGLNTSVSTGVVSAKGRNELDITQIEDFIQTDAAINRGNSGGCLLDLNGYVVGMNTAIASSSGGYMGIGFAIPSNLLKKVQEQLIKHGKVVRGFLGIGYQPVNSNIAEVFSLENSEGVLVASIANNSPAQQAGIEVGDIILKINGKKVDGVGSLKNEILMTPPGEMITLEIKRNEHIKTIEATVTSYPDNGAFNQDIQSELGVVVNELSSDLAARFGYKQDEHGVIIAYVDPESPAAYVGLRKGDLIVNVNKQQVNSPEDFYKALSAIGPKKQVLLYVKSGAKARFVTIQLP